MKISIIGAGNVGSTAAMRIVGRNLADVVLVDTAGGLAKGKALDIAHGANLSGTIKKIIGSADYRDIKGSKVVVVCAGFARKPGMSREDLIAKNGSVIKEVVANIRRYAHSSIILMVTNPLDMMTYLAYKLSGFPNNRVFGMAGLLDSARFARIIADELKVSPKAVKTIIIGPHSDDMIPLLSYTTVKGRPIKRLLPPARLNKLVEDVKRAGSQVVSLLGSGPAFGGAGSAYFAPSLAVTEMVECILKDRRKTISASCCLEGEYGLRDLCIGVPAKIGKDGITDIVELKLTKEEDALLKSSAQRLKQDIALSGALNG